MPWNAPLMLSTWRIAPALAAGNTVVLKPAEWSPLTATLLAERARGGRLPRGRLQRRARLRRDRRARRCRASGRRPRSASPARRRPGSAIIAAGAPTLKRSSVELGGKSPVVVFDDADAERASTRRSRRSSRMNGQRCTAGSRLLVQEPLYERIVDGGRRAGAQHPRRRPVRPGDRARPADPPEHHARVLELHRSRRATRARACSPAAGGPAACAQGNFLEATVIADVDETMQRLPGGDLRAGARGHAVRRRGRGDPARQRHAVRAGRLRLDERPAAARTASRTRSTPGMCWINSQNVRDLRTPFGGVKHSGIGREGGDYAFDFYCETRDRARRARRRTRSRGSASRR